MRGLSLFLILLPSLAYSVGDLKIGGDSSFNDNSGSIHIEASHKYEAEKAIVLERVSARNAELLNTIPIAQENSKKLNAEAAFLHTVKEVNDENIDMPSKNKVCRNKVKAFISIFGNEVDFLYQQCDFYFSE